MRILITLLMVCLCIACQSESGAERAWSAFEREDYETAIRESMPLAQQGNIEAQMILAWLYEQGLGVTADGNEAFKWYLKAAEQGHSYAQYKMGEHQIYLAVWDGSGSYSKAIEWFQRSAEKGNSVGQNALGWAYEKGQGLQKDLMKAFEWYSAAAKQGLPEAQLNLGKMFAAGRGVPLNYAEAYFWLNLAVAKLPDNSAIEAEELRTKISYKMSTQQIAEAQNRTKVWKPTEPKK